jgi:hypothetical protein
MHLQPDDLVDLAEGTRPEASAPHLASCAECRRQLADMRAMMSAAADVDVPEPSPLFWDHLSARVSESVSGEGAPRADAGIGGGLRVHHRRRRVELAVDGADAGTGD